MTSRNDITQEYLKECFDYNPVTGILTWKERPRHHFNTLRAFKWWNSRYSGSAAGRDGSVGKKKYRITSLNNTQCYAHRLIWLLVTGKWPKDQIDHINGNGTDNALTNLREASIKQNRKNMRKHETNKSGTTGVFWMKNCNKWLAYITVDNDRINLGYYKSKEAATIRRKAAELKYCFHANHGSERPL